MVGKWEVPEGVYGTVLQRLRDRVKGGFPEPQCPAVECAHPPVARLKSDALTSPGFSFRPGYALREGRCPARTLKGMSGAPTSCL